MKINEILNVLTTVLVLCSDDPQTGYFRDGYCKTNEQDQGLKQGDKWCICVERWKEALYAGKAPQLNLNASNIKALNYVNKNDIIKYDFKKN
ncbi:hypothetical protein IMG5_091750 [Ichthyophthirius multifiliis]|uniref:Uncharacterized protein n=1 Tax=Ichthyophthirius multifiliis TaxID=5932 RepID=G0QRC9_ICHMU|nr:hypothetical protein IMG5_091750 [Ichthyophthirius multifiliis]EGR32227.1 hypothetical protein IMG5_091750 [Ichthyophthirius multifiliis]|eukprot:XP_004035713.1 hypothetical protein IMG5_091750 [Ichthyophthirius multifiliis]